MDKVTSNTGAAEARQLIDRALARYAALRSYQDQGIVRVDVSNHEPPLDLVFATRYAAPDRFRFEFALPHPFPALRQQQSRHCIGTDATGAYTWTHFPGAAPELRRQRSLALAVAGASGISCGAAATVAQLLMPSLPGIALRAFEPLGLVGECEIDGVPCHRIAAIHPHAGAVEFCLGQFDLMLRQLRKQSAQRGVVELRSEIVLDLEVAAEQFQAPE